MSVDLYKISDIIQFEFFKLPKALFANTKYKAMSSDAKLTYSLLYDRLGLSKMNGWINENDEVYLIYTREEIADALGVTYKKAMAAFRELILNGLIFEKRCGRGMANRIFIVKPDVTVEQAREYEPLRTAETEVLDSGKAVDNSSEYSDLAPSDVPNQQFKNFHIGSSKSPVLDVQELPNREPNQNYINKTNLIQIYYSQSVYAGQSKEPRVLKLEYQDERDLQKIYENCQLEYFDEDAQVMFRDAIERMWYSERLKVGNAILPQANVRSRMWNLDYTKLSSALHNLHQNKERDIKNITAYVISTIFNCIAEEYSLLVVDPYLNQLRAGGG